MFCLPNIVKAGLLKVGDITYDVSPEAVKSAQVVINAAPIPLFFGHDAALAAAASEDVWAGSVGKMTHSTVRLTDDGLVLDGFVSSNDPAAVEALERIANADEARIYKGVSIGWKNNVKTAEERKEGFDVDFTLLDVIPYHISIVEHPRYDATSAVVLNGDDASSVGDLITDISMETTKEPEVSAEAETSAPDKEVQNAESDTGLTREEIVKIAQEVFEACWEAKQSIKDTAESIQGQVEYAAKDAAEKMEALEKGDNAETGTVENADVPQGVKAYIDNHLKIVEKKLAGLQKLPDSVLNGAGIKPKARVFSEVSPDVIF